MLGFYRFPLSFDLSNHWFIWINVYSTALQTRLRQTVRNISYRKRTRCGARATALALIYTGTSASECSGG